MGLKLIKDNGAVRRVWYGQYKSQGKWKVIRLTTKMRGERIPDSLSDEGDLAFEKSRVLAQAEFDKFEKDRSEKGEAAHYSRRLLQDMIGQPVEYVRLDELPHLWRTLPRSYTPTEERMKNADRVFKQFAEFAGCTYLYEVPQSVATAYFNKVRSEYTWSSTQGIMSLLKSAFTRFLPVGSVNPFAASIKRNREIAAARVSRKPLAESELTLLIEESRKDPMLHSLTVTAACTGMRIGDVCNLTWNDVDLREGFISVLTSKAGKRVTIPILDLLRDVLAGALAEHRNGEPFVFPEAAQMYNCNPSGIIRRGKVLFARALFAEDAEKESNVVDADHKEKSPVEVIAAIRKAGFTKQKTERCEMIYNLYESGLTYRLIERKTGLSRGQIADYLHCVEDITGNTIVKWAQKCAISNSRLLKKTRKERKVGEKKYGKFSASLYGWHSLRASFVVLALTHGIPIEVVRRIVGHSTVRMTEEYFNPTKRIMADTVRRKMKGSVLAGGEPPRVVSPAETAPEARGGLARLLARPGHQGTAEAETDELAAMVAKMSPEEKLRLKEMLG